MIWSLGALASIDGPHLARTGEAVVLSEQADVVWWRREVVEGAYDNAVYCGPPLPGCAQPLPFRWERVGQGRELTLNLEPGAHHFAATAPDARPTSEQPVHTVAIRTDDSYVGVLHELLGTPFVFAPAHLRHGHQTDLRLATDCVSLVIYGQRRLGRRVPYVSPHKLYEWLEPTSDPVRVGDVVHWGWQTAVVALDREPVGVLDAGDELILAWRGEAELRTLGSLPFAGTPSTRLRWPEQAAAQLSRPAGVRPGAPATPAAHPSRSYSGRAEP